MDTNFDEIKDLLEKNDGQDDEGKVPTDEERFGRAIPTDTANEKHAKDKNAKTDLC